MSFGRNMYAGCVLSAINSFLTGTYKFFIGTWRQWTFPLLAFGVQYCFIMTAVYSYRNLSTLPYIFHLYPTPSFLSTSRLVHYLAPISLVIKSSLPVPAQSQFQPPAPPNKITWAEILMINR